MQRRVETAPGVHEDAVEHLGQRVDIVGIGRETVRRLRATDREDPFDGQVLEMAPARARTACRPASRCRRSTGRRDGPASRSARDQLPPARGSTSRRYPRRRHTPIACADTPTHAAPARMNSVCATIQSNAMSAPPLTFNHSTQTVPLNDSRIRGPVHEQASRVVGLVDDRHTAVDRADVRARHARERVLGLLISERDKVERRKTEERRASGGDLGHDGVQHHAPVAALVGRQQAQRYRASPIPALSTRLVVGQLPPYAHGLPVLVRRSCTQIADLALLASR